MLRLPPESADAAVSCPQSSARMLSSGIASTNPAPNNGIGARRAITFTSSGICG
jgi:hypothetical protein